MIERMVRDAMAVNEANVKDPPIAGSADVRKPLHNFKMNINKEKMIAANWKMNMTTGEARVFAAKVKSMNIDRKEVVIFPPIYLAPMMINALAGSGIRIGAQNMHHEIRGAFTSEISPLMVKDAGCEFVILGHSERRHIFNEKDHDINLKVISAINHGIVPILCVGETLDQREQNATFRIIRNQLRLGLNGTTPRQSTSLVVAYEPVWAIGTGRTATPEQARNVHSFIRETLTQIYDYSTARDILILYGGSVTPENTESLIKEKDIDGFLVGGASLSPDKFKIIIELC
jgi:triosephosphate isomerase